MYIKALFRKSLSVQNPQAIKKDVEAGNFKIEQMQLYKSYGVFFFTKTI
jgi:hypothetical protein